MASSQSSKIHHGPENDEHVTHIDNNISPPDADSSINGALIERSYRVKELIESEHQYVHDLHQCCEYIRLMRDESSSGLRMPDDLRHGKDRMVFGNIQAIYEWHRDFFSVKLSAYCDNLLELGSLFKKSDRRFQMYVVYCQNKPKSEHIVSEYIYTYFEDLRLALGFKLRITDLLIKPIQRLTKYHMLLEAIVKYSKRAGMNEEVKVMESAFHVMTVVPNQANEMMDVGRLQGFEGKLTAQGKLLHRGPLLCSDDFSEADVTMGSSSGGGGGQSKMKEYTAFLFEQILILSETSGRKTQFTSPVYIYKTHLLVNKMSLVDNMGADGPDQLKFIIRSTDPARTVIRIICSCSNLDEKQRWVNVLKEQFEKQMDFLRALQAPIAYHNKVDGESGQLISSKVSDETSQVSNLKEKSKKSLYPWERFSSNKKSPKNSKKKYCSSNSMFDHEASIDDDLKTKLDLENVSSIDNASTDNPTSKSLNRKLTSMSGARKASMCSRRHFMDNIRQTIGRSSKSGKGESSVDKVDS